MCVCVVTSAHTEFCTVTRLSGCFDDDDICVYIDEWTILHLLLHKKTYNKLIRCASDIQTEVVRTM